MLKHLQLFENYNNSERDIFNSIYESWKGKLSKDLVSLLEGRINESDYFEEEGELSSGERRALAREMQVISKPQLAALYLFALGKEEGDPFKYIFKIPGILDFADKDKSGKDVITYPAFADAIGLESTFTISRTVNKFKNMIAGVGETPGEVIPPKYIKAYNIFKNMNTDTLAGEASETIQDSSTFTKNREAAQNALANSAAYREAEKKNASKYGYMIYQLIMNLRKNPIFNDIKKAQNAAISKISAESGIPTNKLIVYYKTYLSERGLLTKINFAG